MRKTLGIIGAGAIGGIVARHAVDAGLNVVLSNSRDPETLSDLVTDLGSRARAATPAEAARSGDLVVATIPLVAYDKLPVAALAGKTVIDTMNYYPERDGQISELDSGESTSSALVQRHLADSHVVKAFNNISFRCLLTLARPSGAPDRSALPIAGDEPSAKAEVTELLDTLGFDTVDIGTLTESWRSEPNTPVYVYPYFPGLPPFGTGQEEVMRWVRETSGAPVPAHKVKELTVSAVRGPVGGRFSY
ncbi:NADPH-dependent F420 reductase [Streptomyces sp. A012304]|uniref:NADPH-dependent F420 reductase n=1 Tax=Streptomyces sp. A012304 TaxID=375446 RepID=UPI0022326929|nr:NAD(P)-binding domain-containing protein [Streptomyces sp. A012304]GKQ41917.1 NADP oxidoreductase [Streptomyces sp. A012304]